MAMQIKKLLIAVVSTFSIQAGAENISLDSVEIEKAIKLLEEKGYQVDLRLKDKISASDTADLPSREFGNFDAFISGDFGTTRYKHNDLSGDNFLSKRNDGSYGIRGSFAFQHPNKLGLQFDGVYSKDDMGSGELTTLDLATHAFYRNDNFLVGLFGQYKQPRFSHKEAVVDISGDLLTPQQVFFGAESQGYFGDLTVAGQIARQEFVNESAFNVYGHGNVATIKANYFINDDWKISTGYGYNKVYMNDFSADNFNANYNTHKLSIGTEYRFSNYPFSLYADYSHNKFKLNFLDADGDPNLKLRTDTIMAGIKINFGSYSLKSRDRSGASLNPISNKGFADYFGSLLGNYDSQNLPI